jgi:hypothetical protein
MSAIVVSGLAVALFFPASLAAELPGSAPPALDSFAALPATPARQSLPAAPAPQESIADPKPIVAPQLDPCTVKNTGASMAVTGALRALDVLGFTDRSAAASAMPYVSRVCVPHMPIINWYARFLTGPQVNPLTPLEKAHLALHNLIDPFNLITIAGISAISVGANSHSAYGPGMRGYGRYVGVSFTQDMTGEFFGTFLIPSLTHQDPHYHRMPDVSIARRVLHCVDQVEWTQGDDGQGMPNYANLVGFAFDDAISDLYVPGERHNMASSTSRYGIALATAPVDNCVIEFLPDLARHVHIQVVIIQRIINRVSVNSTP